MLVGRDEGLGDKLLMAFFIAFPGLLGQGAKPLQLFRKGGGQDIILPGFQIGAAGVQDPVYKRGWTFSSI